MKTNWDSDKSKKSFFFLSKFNEKVWKMTGRWVKIMPASSTNKKLEFPFNFKLIP